MRTELKIVSNINKSVPPQLVLYKMRCTKQQGRLRAAASSQSVKFLEIFAAPFDLRLSDGEAADEDVTNVCQPDLVVICDKSQLKGTGYFGIPDLVIEIISPSTAKTDRLLKFNMYEKFGVKEYWIVEPDTKLVSVFILQENARYGRPELYSETAVVKVSIFPDLVVNLSTVFEF